MADGVKKKRRMEENGDKMTVDTFIVCVKKRGNIFIKKDIMKKKERSKERGMGWVNDWNV